MHVELVSRNSVQEGVKEFRDETPSFRDIMKAKTDLDLVVSPEGNDLWDTYLDSKNTNFYGKTNEDGRHRFKMDHSFSIDKIANTRLKNCAVPSTENNYLKSQGTEFIVLDETHAIRVDKYEKIKEKLTQKDYSLDNLEDGIFKINVNLLPDEVVKYNKEEGFEDRSLKEKYDLIDKLTLDDVEYVHDGLLEHALGENGAYEDKEKQLEAVKLLAKYVERAKGENCFREDGMGFFVNTENNNYEVRPWFVGNSHYRSDANGGGSFSDDGRFLRVLDQSAAGAAPEITPEAITNYLKLSPPTTREFALTPLDSANTYLQAE